MGRRAAADSVFEPETSSGEPNGEVSAKTHVPLTSAQRVAASSAPSTEIAPDPFGKEAKHFTEMRVLNRDVCKFLHNEFSCFFCCFCFNLFPFLNVLSIMLDLIGTHCSGGS